MKKTLIVIVVLIVAYLVYYFVVNGLSARKPGATDNLATSDGSIYSGIGNGLINPAEKIPATNPFGIETNPYKNVYKNPFANR